MNGKNLQVSASTFMPSQGKLACGRTDGSIILVPAVETIVLHLLDGGQDLGRSPIMISVQPNSWRKKSKLGGNHIR